MVRAIRFALVLAALLFSSATCTSAPPRSEPRSARAPGLDASARPWPEGSALFHRDPRWAGADSAYSLALDRRRVLWLFGDTFVDPAADGSRTNGANHFTRNSVAIQLVAGDAPDASVDTVAFHWGSGAEGVPSSFFRDRDGSWLWPLAGVRLPSGPLLLFRMHVTKVEGGLGFAVAGWDAVAVDDPEPDPRRWVLRDVQTLTRSPPLLAGTSVLLHEGYLYAYAARNDEREHALHLARWPLEKLGRVPAGALADPEWFTGPTTGFVAQSRSPQPVPLFRDGQTELSVHYDSVRKRFVEIQIRGLLLNDPQTALAYRTAPRPEGPWTPLIPLLRPPEANRPDVAQLVAYAGKAHPEQAGPGLVVSYVVHSLSAPVPPDALYFPQLVRVQLK